MRSGCSFDQIFPIRDVASANLMRLKADCLLDAGVIDFREHREVYARSAALLEDAGEYGAFGAVDPAALLKTDPPPASIAMAPLARAS